MIASLDGLFTIMSHDPLITWCCEIGGSLTGGGSGCKRLSRHQLLVDIFEDNYNIVRECFETGSINVMKNRPLAAKKQRKFQYILAWLSLSKDYKNCH